MYFWASKSLSTRDKSLHGRWLQSLKGRCIITQELDVQILGNGEAVYRDSEKGRDISLAISGEPDKNACDEQASSKMVQESFQDLSVADYNSQTPTKMVESVTRKCFSDPSQKLKGGLKKHQRSFEQERSILATRQHLFVEREGHESQYAHKTSRYPESDIESLPSNPANDREEIIESQKELHKRLDQFMGCIAQQQTTMMAVLDRLEHQQRVSETQDLERKSRKRESSPSSNEEKERGGSYRRKYRPRKRGNSTSSSSNEGEMRRIQSKPEGMSNHKTDIPKLELYSGKDLWKDWYGQFQRHRKLRGWSVSYTHLTLPTTKCV